MGYGGRIKTESLSLCLFDAGFCLLDPLSLFMSWQCFEDFSELCRFWGVEREILYVTEETGGFEIRV